MPPDMEFLAKLRITRLFLLEKLEEETEPFNRDCLEVALKVIDKEIVIAEYKRYCDGGTGK